MIYKTSFYKKPEIFRYKNSSVLHNKQQSQKNLFIQLLGLSWWVYAFLYSSSCIAQNSLIEKSENWDRIYYKEYLIENATWNTQAAQGKWEESIFCDTITGSMGWRWDFSGEKDEPGSYVGKSYPEIIYGRKPFDVYTSTTPKLPIELSLAKVSLEYDYKATAEGVYNTTTDISFTDSKNPDNTNIKAKMMIWFDRSNIPFFESETLRNAVIGGLNYKVFINPNHEGPEGKWVFIAMLPDSLPSNGMLNLNDFFNYALTHGALKPEWFLSSIEMGSEISSGKGEIEFKKFIVR